MYTKPFFTSSRTAEEEREQQRADVAPSTSASAEEILWYRSLSSRIFAEAGADRR
jgi:hypothetical protein